MEIERAERDAAADPSQREGRRLFRRQQYVGSASICRAIAPVPHKATVIDLSREGCLLRLLVPADFEIDEEVEVSVQSPDLSFRATASVRQVRDGGTLIGLHLQRLTFRGNAYLAALVEELEGRAASSE